jgi:heme o synthase
MPTLIGWSGAAGRIDPQAWTLFSILFLWQFPHFLAIALMYREDYARAGYRMLPRFDEDARFTRVEILCFTIVLVAVTAIPVGTLVKPLYALGMFGAGSFMMYYVLKLARSRSTVAAGKLLHASILYLPVVLGLMVLSKLPAR